MVLTSLFVIIPANTTCRSEHILPVPRTTGSEDNGIHVGLNGEWPESGQRMQWCEGKHQWTWASKQRTQQVHCGVPKLIYLEVEKEGWNTVSFSMREYGFEFDKFLLSQVYFNPEEGIPELIKRKVICL